MLYYMIGIFRGEPHPVPKSERVKHNPLQRITYLGISVFLIPFQMITGLLYYTYNSWPEMGISELASGPSPYCTWPGALPCSCFWWCTCT